LPLPSNQLTIPVKLGGTKVVVVFVNTSVRTVADVTVQVPIEDGKLLDMS
jgi:predicted NBD/HSP70 family sugar kinase